MDSPIAEDSDYVFLSSRSSSVSTSCANSRCGPETDQQQQPQQAESEQLTITRERCSSIVRRCLSWQPKQQAPPLLNAAAATANILMRSIGGEDCGSPGSRSRNPSDNGAAAQLSAGLRRPMEDFHSSRGLWLLHRTLSTEVRAARAQSTSDSPSLLPNASLTSSNVAESFSTQHSATSNLVRLHRSAKGQSAPNLSTAGREPINRRSSNWPSEQHQHRIRQQSSCSGGSGGQPAVKPNRLRLQSPASSAGSGRQSSQQLQPPQLGERALGANKIANNISTQL